MFMGKACPGVGGLAAVSQAWPSNAILLVGLVMSSVLCVALGGWAQDHFGRKDPGPCVLDEAAGICLTLLFQPVRYSVGWVILGGFLVLSVVALRHATHVPWQPLIS